VDVTAIRYRYKKFTTSSVEDVRGWCKLHMKGMWSVTVGQNWTDTFYFEDNSDALYFGLYWKCGN